MYGTVCVDFRFSVPQTGGMANASSAKQATDRSDHAVWMEAALSLLADGGIEAVKVEPLAKRLGVTKGAFYPRFPTRAALLDAMLDYWRQGSTLSVFDMFQAQAASAQDRLELLLYLPTRRPDARDRARLEMAIRIWGHSDPRADATMREIDTLRLKFIQTTLAEAGLPPLEAEARAFMLYAYVITDGTLPGDRSEAVREACRAFLRRDTGG